MHRCCTSWLCGQRTNPREVIRFNNALQFNGLFPLENIAEMNILIQLLWLSLKFVNNCTRGATFSSCQNTNIKKCRRTIISISYTISKYLVNLFYYPFTVQGFLVQSSIRISDFLHIIVVVSIRTVHQCQKYGNQRTESSWWFTNQ